MHNVAADTTFGICIYGYGIATSYGYIGGMSYTPINNGPIILTTNSPICIGDDLKIFADTLDGATYHWLGPDGYSSNEQNVIIKNVTLSNAGKYTVYVTYPNSKVNSSTVDITVSNELVSPGDSSYMFVGSAVREADYIKLTNAKVLGWRFNLVKK